VWQSACHSICLLVNHRICPRSTSFFILYVSATLYFLFYILFPLIYMCSCNILSMLMHAPHVYLTTLSANILTYLNIVYLLECLIDDHVCLSAYLIALMSCQFCCSCLPDYLSFVLFFTQCTHPYHIVTGLLDVCFLKYAHGRFLKSLSYWSARCLLSEKCSRAVLKIFTYRQSLTLSVP